MKNTKITSTFQSAFFALVFSLLITEGLAQSLPSVIPPSPTAAALGKYGEVPVSTYTGTANISIPLYTLEGRGVSVPISLSYHTSGVKVEETASWVGMGWSLNAGGVITRSVVGVPDEGQGGYFSVYANEGILFENADYAHDVTIDIINNPSEFQDVKEMLDNDRDTSPDVYYYNFNGQSGKLMFDENGDFHTSPHSNLKIIKKLQVGNVREWILLDGNGVKYFFGSSDGSNQGIEYTGGNGEPSPPNTAWYLTKIVTPQKETVLFEYDYKEIAFERPSSQTFTWYHPDQENQFWVDGAIGGTRPGLPGDFSQQYMITSPVSGFATLKRIRSSYGTIEFTASNDRDDITDGIKLSNIIISDFTGKKIREFELGYKYEAGHHERLYLASITETGQTGERKPPYIFEYYTNTTGVLQGKLPDRNSLGQDYWGYYNGANINAHLIGRNHSFNGITFPSSFQFSDRDSHEEYMKTGALNRIYYPTGGYTEIAYEANTAKIEDSFVSDPLVVNKASSRGTQLIEPFTVNFKQQVSFDISFLDYREADNYWRPYVKLEKLEGAGWIEERIWRPSYPALNDENLYTNIDVDPGDYRFVIDTEDCSDPEGNCNTPAGLPEDLYTVEVKLTYYDSGGPGVNQIKAVGGLRVKQIADYLKHRSTPNNLKVFTYDPGILVSTPVYTYSYVNEYCRNFYNSIVHGPTCDDFATTNHYVATSHSYANLGTSQGSHVVYPKVTESRGTNAEDGYIENYYSTNGLLSGGIYDLDAASPPFAPKDHEDYLNGLLSKQITFNAAGNKVLEVTNNYTNAGQGLNYHMVKRFKVLKSYEYSPFNKKPPNLTGFNELKFYYDQYKTQSKWVYLKSTTKKFYDPVDENKVTQSIVSYDYGSEHLQPTIVTTVESDDQAQVTNYYYPSDYDLVASGTIKDMKDAHIQNAVVETVNKIGDVVYNPTAAKYEGTNLEITGGQYTKYAAKNAIIIPAEVKNLETNTKLPENDLQLSTLQPSGDEDAGHYQVRQHLDYDNYGNIIKVKKDNGTDISYLWGYNHLYPIAKIENAIHDDSGIAGTSNTVVVNMDVTPIEGLTSGTVVASLSISNTQDVVFSLSTLFEQTQSGNIDAEMSFDIKDGNGTAVATRTFVSVQGLSDQTVQLTSGNYSVTYSKLADVEFHGTFTYETITNTYTRVNEVSHENFEEYAGAIASATPHSGRQVFQGTYSVELRDKIEGDYILSYWMSTDGQNWQQHQQSVTVNSTSTTQTIGTVSNYLDDVQFYPSDAWMYTYTYDPMIGITSQTDPNGITTYYEYDDFGRLEYAKDTDGNIIKRYQYNYKNSSN